MTLLMNIKLIFFFNCRIKGIHLNMVAVPTPGANIGLMLGSLWPSLLMPADKVHLVYPLSTRFIHIIQETGYFHLQATKPDTVHRPRKLFFLLIMFQSNFSI